MRYRILVIQMKDGIVDISDGCIPVDYQYKPELRNVPYLGRTITIPESEKLWVLEPVKEE